MQEMEKKMGQTSLFLPFLRHITQIQIGIIINVSLNKHQNVKILPQQEIKAMLGMLGGGENLCGWLFMMELLPLGYLA